MKENEVEKCYCELGFEKGAIKKSCEFENFSIFGNLMKKNTIVIRYNGCLTKTHLNKSHKIILYYVFNNEWTNKQEIELKPCLHEKDSFCATIDLRDNMCITFGFYNSNGEYDKNLANSYSLKIANNTIDDIMKRYGIEENHELPVTLKDTKNMSRISSIFSKIKGLITNIYSKISNA